MLGISSFWWGVAFAGLVGLLVVYRAAVWGWAKHKARKLRAEQAGK
jgi:hypothetical protein